MTLLLNHRPDPDQVKVISRTESSKILLAVSFKFLFCQQIYGNNTVLQLEFNEFQQAHWELVSGLRKC